MKTLTLIRHAKSDWHSPAVTDFDRPLNKRGTNAAPLMGQRLAAKGLQPDLMVSSPAKRARQTAKRIAEELAYPAENIDFVAEIYEASRLNLIQLVLQLAPSADQVILLGHNPGFSELGQWLCPAAPDWLPTCGVLILELPLARWDEITENCADLREYDYPKRAPDSNS